MKLQVNIKALREKRNWNLSKLSIISTVPYSTLWDIEQGKHLPSLENYVLICLAFGLCPFNKLLEEKEEFLEE